jgi:hypothetical protein
VCGFFFLSLRIFIIRVSLSFAFVCESIFFCVIFHKCCLTTEKYQRPSETSRCLSVSSAVGLHTHSNISYIFIFLFLNLLLHACESCVSRLSFRSRPISNGWSLAWKPSRKSW